MSKITFDKFSVSTPVPILYGIFTIFILKFDVIMV